MNGRQIAICALLLAFAPMAVDARGGGGFRGGGGGFRGGGGMSRGSMGSMSRPAPSTMSRPSGGFDFHNDAAAPKSAPQGSYSHSSTGAYGTQRTTNVTNTGSGYNKTTTATNGDYSRTTNSGASNGNYSRNTSASNASGHYNSSTTGNSSTGNYNRTASGSGANGSFNTTAGGNTQSGTYNRNTSGTNAYGNTFNTNVNRANGNTYVNRSGTVNNPVYGGYPTWGWNAGVAWYPAPYYWGGGFWGPYALGVTTAVVYGEVVENGQTETSYEVKPDSPGAKLLASYKLTQTQCGKPNLVVIHGPNNSVICAFPNDIVSAGNYTVDESNLTIVSKNS